MNYQASKRTENKNKDKEKQEEQNGQISVDSFRFH